MENANSKVIGRTRNHRLGLQRVAILIASAGAATFGIVVDPQVGTIAVFIAGIVFLMFFSYRFGGRCRVPSAYCGSPAWNLRQVTCFSFGHLHSELLADG